MSRTKSTMPTAQPPAYQYSPGDRHTYLWDGGEVATVLAMDVDTATGLVRYRDTGDRIPMDGCDRTATALAARVAAWKVTRS